MNIKGRLYRLIMRIAHKYNWHYAPPIYPEGDVQLWCKWCGFRQSMSRKEWENTHVKYDRSNCTNQL